MQHQDDRRAAQRLGGVFPVGGGVDQDADPLAPAKIGAGILVYGPSPTITQNELVGNSISSPTSKLYYGGGIVADAGGGIALDEYDQGAGSIEPSRGTIDNNTIHNNTDCDTGGGGRRGGGIGNACDNCPTATNANQANDDCDTLGDDCDPDLDGDGTPNAKDCRPNDPAISGPSGEVAGVAVTNGTATTTLNED